MKIIYSSASNLGGTGLSNVAFHAVRASYNAEILKKAVVYRNRQKEIPSRRIKRVVFQPAKVCSSLPSRYYYTMKRMWLDWRVSKYLKHQNADIFHGWTHECLESLKVATQKGMLAIVERGYSHPLFSERILNEEYDIYEVKRDVSPPPAWLRRFDHWRRELEDALHEFALADYVFVNSQFCYETFVNEGYDEKKLVMIPRGFEPARYMPAVTPNDTFRVVFVGLLCVRKGLKYLLEAWERLGLKNAELLLVGRLHDEMKPLMKPYLQREDIVHVDFTPDPVSYYHRGSVFVFPSVDEGSAKVTYEAMACGLPVITTHNSGSLVRDGQDGYIVPIRSVDALAEKILYFYRNRDAAMSMGREARSHIEQFTWERYERVLVETYRDLLERKHQVSSQDDTPDISRRV